jgi:hypothetical protein
MRWRIPLVAVLALFVAVSCDQQVVQPQEEAATASFDFMNNADNTNPKIIRQGEHWGWWGWDLDSQLVSIQSTGPWSCGMAPEEMEMLSVQYVTDTPMDDWPEGLVRLLQMGDVWIGLWDGSSLDWADWGPTNLDCDWFLAHELIADGYGKMKGKDNDIFHWTCERNKTNVWGARAQGVLDLADGPGTVDYNYKFQSSWSCLHPDKGSKTMEFIHLD